MQESVEAVGEFVVACREATKLFEPVEESLNQVARFVPLPIELARPESVATRRDDGLSARLGDCCDEHIAVISLVSDDCIGLDGIDQCRPLRNVGCLATSEDQAQWIAGWQSRHEPHKRGLNTKVHLAVDAHGMPLRVVVTEGTRADCAKAGELIAIDAAGAYPQDN